MSIKIIRNSMTDPIKCECPNCASTFTYNYEDIQRREECNIFGTSYTNRFVICPVCKFDIGLQKTVVAMTTDAENKTITLFNETEGDKE